MVLNCVSPLGETGRDLSTLLRCFGPRGLLEMPSGLDFERCAVYLSGLVGYGTNVKKCCFVYSFTAR